MHFLKDNNLFDTDKLGELFSLILGKNPNEKTLFYL